MSVVDGTAHGDLGLDGLSFAMSWIEPALAHGFLGARSTPSPAEDVARLAEALGVQLAFVPAATDWAAECATLLRARGCAVGWVVSGPLGLVADGIGWSEVLKLSAAEPASLASLLAGAVRESSERSRVGARLGAAAIVIADDLAGDSGWLVSPDFALSSVVPCVAQIAADARRLGMTPIHHSDGDVRLVFDALREAGVAGVHVGALAHGAFPGVLAAARDAGLVALGGIHARQLGGADGGSAGLAEQATELTRCVADGHMIVCDDGGITTVGELRGLAATIAAVRQGLEGRWDTT